MARKSIFEQLSGYINYQSELQRIDSLLNNKSGISIRNSDNSNVIKYSVVQFMDLYIFAGWKNRYRCITCEDMCEALGLQDYIDETEDNPDDDTFLSYLEYAANLVNLVRQAKTNDGYSLSFSSPYKLACQNIKACLDCLNFEAKEFVKEQKTLVVQKNAAATAVAEIVSADIAYEVVHYNHFLLKGDIDTKKKILIKLGSDLEPKRAEIKQINPELESSIFFMLNNMDLRHNNRSKKDKNYNEVVAKMRKPKLEDWYDELYQMILLAYLELDQKARSERVKELKCQIKQSKESQGEKE